jgi:DNA replication protein DnaC
MNVAPRPGPALAAVYRPPCISTSRRQGLKPSPSPPRPARTVRPACSKASKIRKPLVLELLRCEYVERRENVLLVGGPGTGKTHLATAPGVEACGRGKRVRFYRVTELITQLLEAREERQLGRMKSPLAKLDLLIPDELGYVPASKAGAELLFDVISRSYERGSVIVTSNLPFEQWTEVLLSERLTGATLDRLTHRCTILETGGESYRLRAARRRRRGEEVDTEPEGK